MEINSSFVNNSNYSIPLISKLLLSFDVVNKFYIPLLCLFGSLGNCLSLIVFRQKSYPRLSSTIYLSGLTVADTFFLINLFILWIDDHFWPILNVGPICPIVIYFGQTTTFISVYLTVAFTLERYLAINYPFSKRSICRASRAKKIVIFIFFTSHLIFSYALIIARSLPKPFHEDLIENEEIQDETNVDSFFSLRFSNENETNSKSSGSSSVYYYKICTVENQYHNLARIASYLDSIFTLVLPWLLITYLNTRIAICVCKTRIRDDSPTMKKEPTKSQGQSQGQGQERANAVEVQSTSVNVNQQQEDPIILKRPFRTLVHFTYKYAISFVNIRDQQINNNFNGGRDSVASTLTRNSINIVGNGSRQSHQEFKITILLLLVSAIFLLLNLPSHLLRAFIFFWTVSNMEISEEIVALQQWANLLFYTNFGINFLLYCAFGKNFRNSLRNIFKKKKTGGNFRKSLGKILAQLKIKKKTNINEPNCNEHFA